MMKFTICALLILGLSLGLLGCGNIQFSEVLVKTNASPSLDVSPFFSYDGEKNQFQFDTNAFCREISLRCSCGPEQLDALIHSLRLEKSLDLTAVSLVYDSALASSVGITLTGTSKVFPTADCAQYLTVNPQEPDVL